MIGHTLYGHGPKRVIVLHDWFCDSSSYNFVKSYLDPQQATYAFVDLRGYGKSIDISGVCNLEEACGDVLMLANHLKWVKFSIIGHSMSGQIAMAVGAQWNDRVEGIMAVTPVPPEGIPIPEDVLETLEKGAFDNDIIAQTLPNFMTSNRYHNFFAFNKVKKWRNCSAGEARIAYLQMYTQTNIEHLLEGGLETPMRLITGAWDGEAHLQENLMPSLSKYFRNIVAETLPCGHYPMEEVPVMLAAQISAFVS
jgi:pimeloyl-ACP methyl ester carboxylesterase